MKQLWEWTATDQFGKPRDYQAHGPDVTEAGMLEFLKGHFPNITITNLRRLNDGQYKPATGIVEAHTYHFGAYDAVLRSQGITPRTDMISQTSKLIKRSPIIRKPL